MNWKSHKGGFYITKNQAGCLIPGHPVIRGSYLNNVSSCLVLSDLQHVIDSNSCRAGTHIGRETNEPFILAILAS
jgi:hypothetical protein